MSFFDEQAERDVIGSMLLTNDGRHACLELLSSADFHGEQARQVFAAFERLHARGAAVDVSIAATESGVARPWLMSAQAEVPMSKHATEYARRVAEAAWHRRVFAVAVDLAESAKRLDTPTVLQLTQSLPELAPPSAPVTPALHVSELLDRTYVQRWLVPGLLERRDRMMLTGPEGRGKSLWLRQTAVRLASGLHPFSPEPITPCHVLLVDLENSEQQLQRSLARLVQRAREETQREPSLWVEPRGQGLDLCASTDARWLDALVRHHRPDVLVFGPLYKAYRGAFGRAKHAEESAELVAARLDELRVKYDCTLLMEAHAGHGDQGDRNQWRPYGASLWRRWPEFGFGLKPSDPHTVEWASWRYVRERGRDWPERLVEGERWPWETL